MRPVSAAFVGLAMLLSTCPPTRAATAERTITAADPGFHYSGYVHLERNAADGAVRFDRVLDVPGRGYRWDNPAVRISFRTDARHLTVLLRYSAGHAAAAPRNSIGLFVIDGKRDPSWTFAAPTTAGRPPIEDAAVRMPVPAGEGFHDYAIVLPYGDSVDFRGVQVNDSAELASPRAAPVVRYVAFGDSVTHGFTATHVGHTYPFLVAEKNDWLLINLGFGGRRTYARDAQLIADQRGDVVTILIGVNDWQGGVDPEEYRRNLHGLLTALRARQSTVAVHVITSLWVSPNWKPKLARFPLEHYRQLARETVAALHDARIDLIEGPELIEPEERFFDPVLVHPNDAGFAMMAERLAPRLGLKPR